jgi:hypothetical protein
MKSVVHNAISEIFVFLLIVLIVALDASPYAPDSAIIGMKNKFLFRMIFYKNNIIFIWNAYMRETFV